MILYIVGGIIAAIAIAWCVLALVTRIVGKKYDRDWVQAGHEERRRMQEAAYRKHVV